MDEYILEQNSMCINDWIKKNPNFYDFKFKDNILTTPDGEEIDLSNFLLPTLLNNQLINDTITVMSDKTFIRILKLNIKAFRIENTTNKALINDGKIEKIEIVNGCAKAILEKKAPGEEENAITITGHKAREVLSTYTTLVSNSTVHIPLSTLLKNLNNDKFYDLINTNYELSKEDFDYINVFSDYMFDLMYDKSLLIKEAQELLNNYEFEMNSLQAKENRTPNQTTALNIYLDKLRDFEIKIANKEKEDMSRNNKSSRGYSLLALIATSVIVTAMLLVLLIITK